MSRCFSPFHRKELLELAVPPTLNDTITALIPLAQRQTPISYRWRFRDAERGFIPRERGKERSRQCSPHMYSSAWHILFQNAHSNPLPAIAGRGEGFANRSGNDGATCASRVAARISLKGSATMESTRS